MLVRVRGAWVLVGDSDCDGSYFSSTFGIWISIFFLFALLFVGRRRRRMARFSLRLAMSSHLSTLQLYPESVFFSTFIKYFALA